MALIKKTHLECDKCGATFGADNPLPKGMQQRTLARQDGWIYAGSKDFCAKCIPSQHQPARKIKPGRDFHLERICRQYKITFTNGRFCSHVLFDNSGVRLDKFTINWPGHALDGEPVFKQVQTARKASGEWGKATTTYFVDQGANTFSSLEAFIEHYAPAKK